MYKCVLTLLALYKLFMSNDWNFDFPFSPLFGTPDNVDMLSAGNHLEENNPSNEPFSWKKKFLNKVILFNYYTKPKGLRLVQVLKTNTGHLIECLVKIQTFVEHTLKQYGFLDVYVWLLTLPNNITVFLSNMYFIPFIFSI